MKGTLLTTCILLASTCSVYAAEAVGNHKDDFGHKEKIHFTVPKPESVEAAWTTVETNIVAARQAIQKRNADLLDERSERLVKAVTALHDHPQAVKEENGAKLTKGLDDMLMTVDRFHHAADSNDIATATQSLDVLQKQVITVKSLYPSLATMEP